MSLVKDRKQIFLGVSIPGPKRRRRKNSFSWEFHTAEKCEALLKERRGAKVMMSSRKWKESNYRSGYHCYHYYVCLSSRNFYICYWKAQWPFHWFRVRRFLINQQKIRFCARVLLAKQTWCNNALWRFVETICSVKEVTLLFVSPYWITTSFVKGLNASKITYMFNPRVHNPLWPLPKGQYQVTLTLLICDFSEVGKLKYFSKFWMVGPWQNVLNTKQKPELSCLPFWW